VALEHARALSGVEGKPVTIVGHDAAVGVAMQEEIMLLCDEPLGLARVVDDQDPLPRPHGLEGRLGQDEAISLRSLVQLLAQYVVIAVHAKEWGIETSETIECRRPGDVSGMHDAIDTGPVQDLHDARYVSRIVVGIADDTDPHGRRTGPVRGRPPVRSGLLEDVDRAGAAETDDVGHADLGALHLALVCLAPQMGRDLVDIRDPGRPEWVSLGEETA
jgi:hypothetical protein